MPSRRAVFLPRLLYTDSALRELSEIAEYLRLVSDGPSAPAKFLAHVDARIALICDNPELYGLSRLKELASKGFHATYIDDYVMLYFVRDNTVYIAHVFHRRQNYAKPV